MDERKETAMRRALAIDDDLHVGHAVGVGAKDHGFRVSMQSAVAGALQAGRNDTKSGGAALQSLPP